MFTINEDNSIYATRGDTVFFWAKAEQDGNRYKFQPGEVLRMKIYGKKDAENVVLQKDFPVTEVTEAVEIYLSKTDTKFGEVISKPRDYWYEIELHHVDEVQTILGYGEDGPALFRLMPEGDEVPETPVTPEDIPIVDDKLDMTSTRPVQNQAVARAYQALLAGYEKTAEAVSEVHVTPEMFGAIGDGEADDTKAIQDAIDANDIIFFGSKTYIVSGVEIPANKIVHFANTVIKKTDESICPAVKITGSNVSILGTPTIIGTQFDDKTEFCHCMSIVNNEEPIGNIYVESLRAENAQGDGLYIGSASQNLYNIKVGQVVSKNCFRHGLAITSGQDVTIDSIICENCSVDYEPYGANVELRNIMAHKVIAKHLSVVPQAGLAYNIQFGNVVLNNDSVVALTVHSCDHIKFDQVTIENSGTSAILFDNHHGVKTRLCEIGSLYVKDAYCTYAEGTTDAGYIKASGVEKVVIGHADICGDIDRTIDLFLGNGNDVAEIVVNGGLLKATRIGRYVTVRLANCTIECTNGFMGGYDGSFVRNCTINCSGTLFAYATIDALAHDNIIVATTLQSNASWKLYNNIVNGTFTS